MTSASSSTPQPAIPVNSHPLLADDLPSRGRRTRDASRKEHGDHPPPTDSANTRTPNYFTLKERLDTKAQASPSNGRANWDGSVRGYGKADRPHTTRDTSSNRQPLPTTWDRPPTFVVGSSKDRLSVGSMARTAELVAIDGLPTGAASHILSNPWHDYSDEAIQSAISSISVTESPASVSSHPYHTSLRVLSSAVHNLTKIRREMGESLRVIQEKERARRQRAEELMKELQPSERDIARRVMQSLFTNDDEGMHHVERSQSQMVSDLSIDMYEVGNRMSQSLTDTLSEAMVDGVVFPRIEEPLGLDNVNATPTASKIVVHPATESPPSAGAGTTESSTRPQDHDLADASSVHSSGRHSLSAPSLESTKSDRSSLSDWMGSLWGKPRHKHQRSPLPQSQDDISDSDPILPGEPPHDVPPSSPSSIKPGRRKVSRSVFGTLGFSILNPVPATPGKRGHRPSITDVSTPTTQSPITDVDVPKLPTTLSSPISTAFTPSILAAPSLTTELQHSDALSQTPSQHSLRATVEKQPQGSALPAIVNATRVMTTGPNSVLVEHGAGTSAFIAKLAYELVKVAREEEIEIHAPSKERRDRRQDREHDQNVNPKATIVKNTGIDVTTSLSRALSGPEDIPTVKAKSRTTTFSPPLLSSFLQQQQRRPPAHADRNARHNSNPAESSQPSQNNASSAQPAVRQNASVPLESIIPATFKPPTEYLSRAYTPLTAQNFRPSIVGPVSLPPLPTHRADSEPLVDRFGFMYDIALYDVLLLVRARTCRCAAPACLTGVKIADRTEDEWSDEEADVAGIEIIKESPCPCDGEIELPARPQSRTSSMSGRRLSNAASGSGDVNSNTSSNGNFKAAPGASPCMAILAVGPDTPRHVCANVVRRLLSELTTIHDERQVAQRKGWDTFVRAQRRSRVQTLPTPSPSGGGGGSVSGGAAALLGLDGPVAEDELAHSDGLIGFTQLGRSAGREERRELGRLVRGGVPLAYRAKVWLESSGGLEMQEPGVFAELLAQTDSDGGSVVREIDKDVGRTMPLNMFFGGDGVGVQKLRRVLIAYSRCVSPFPFSLFPPPYPSLWVWV